MNHRPSLLAAFEAVTAARRDAQVELDDSRTTLFAAMGSAPNEEVLQTQAAMVRQLENAARELADAIRTCDQLARLSSG